MPARNSSLLRFFLFFLLALIGAGVNSPSWALTRAGTAVTNRALGSYVDGETGFSSVLQSNIVSAEVQPLEALTLAPNQAVQSPAGAPVNLPHRLINTGNTQSHYKISLSNAAGDNFDLTDLKVYRDLNDNGIADVGEPEVSAQPVVLDMGESASLVIKGIAPGSAIADSNAQIKLTAETIAQATSATNTDLISISSALSLQSFNAASVPTAKAGDLVTFTFSALNRGNSAPLPTTIIIDGTPRNLVLIRDAIPANTSLTSFINKATGQALYHRLGDPEQTYLSHAPQNLNTVDAVAYAVPAFVAGSTVQASFTVQLHHNINVELRNTAQLVFAGLGTTGLQTIDSNEVRVSVPDAPATLLYYTDATFSKVANAASFNSPLFIEANSARDNKIPTAIERITVTTTSLKTGDVMRVDAIETSPNSGIFRVVTTPVNHQDTRVPANGILEAQSGDTITGTFISDGVVISNSLLIDPLGVVYDSRTNAPLAGARVTLIDVTGTGNGGHPGQEATVTMMNGSSAPATVITNASGQFQYPQIAPSTYRLVVVPPTGYTFPSKVPAGLQPIGRVINDSGSYGGNFTVTAGSNTIQIDVPLDGQAAQSGLFLEKTVARHQVEMGEFLDYTLHLKNSTTAALSHITLADVLPAGFKFQAGTARLNGTTIVPTVASGRNLSFDAGSLAVGAESTLTYRILVGVGTKLGKNTNLARATSGNTQSNEASVIVEVQGGVFDDKGIIMGRIWVDTNRDDQIQDGEPGIPGVRVWLEDGTFVLTDEDGKYSFYGLEARTHVVKVDVTTLPNGVRLQSLSSRYGKGGASYIIDLKKGELHKVNFADRAATPEIIAEARERRTLVAQGEGEAAQSLRTTLTPDGSLIQPGDVRALPSSGFVGNANQTRFGVNSGENGGPGLAPSQHALAIGSLNSNLPTKPITNPLPTLEAVLPTLNSDLGFINLKDGQTLAFAQSNVQVKGATGSNFKLRVNGVEIPEGRVGQKSTSPDGKVEAWEFVGARMNPGHNTLRLEQTDSFGIARGQIEISVIAPGDLGRLDIIVPATSPFADGHSLAKVTVRLSDAKGATVSNRTAVTLEASIGQWQIADLNPTEPGVQVFIEGGKAEFSLLAPAQPANCDIRISSGALQSTAGFAFVPELRPLFVNGLASARINLFGFKARGAGVLRTQDIFENEDSARGALFVKGRILGSSLLTLRYDSQKREDDRLFRDIQPDAYYPIYGDDSSRGFDAQSTGKLYVRVDNQKSYVLYGDYTTSSLNSARSLGDYNRSLNGFKTHVEKGRLNANLFASNDNARQVVDEIRANGTSGRYLLRSGDIRDQSEKVEIIVRDRNQPSVVLQTTPQTRFVDYTLDGFSQGLVFRSPVPSVDSNLNPIYIRVTYEVEQGGPKFLVAGGDLQYRLNNKVEVGGSYSRDKNPQDPYSLRSLNATVRFAPNTTLVGEWAQSERGALTGNAQRIELLHEGRKLATRLFWGRSDRNFDNPAALLTQGRQEASFKATYKLNGSSRVIAEAIRSNDIAGGGTRTGAQVTLQRSLANGIQVEAGIRKVKDSGNPYPDNTNATPADFTSLRAKITAPVPGLPRANASLEYERAIQGSGQVLAIGGDYQIANRGRVYIRHELISSLSGRYGLGDDNGPDQQTTLIGIDADYMKNGRVFSEYRMGGGISGRDAQASIGLRNAWSLGQGVRFNTTFERIRDMSQSGQGVGDSTAITGALEYTRSRNFKGTARLELRSGRSDSVLGTVGVAYKISPSLSLLGKGVYSRTSSGTGVDLTGQNQSRAVLGLAYRSTKNDRLQALLKYELRRNTGSLTSRLRRNAQIASLNVNYQATRKWNLSGHYALQRGYDDSNGLVSNAMLQVLSGRATYNMGRRTDLSLLASTSHSAGVSQMGIGAELGVRLSSNLRLSAGYLLGHFRDTDASGLDLDDSGFYLRFGYEFDESLLGGLAP
ncbi:hypothetical protein IAD21_02840 [Abditibacteriota bacterium]|nr:hypothetical protein IAD21_02840 [Abditibacteriota bacterium]